MLILYFLSLVLWHCSQFSKRCKRLTHNRRVDESRSEREKVAIHAHSCGKWIDSLLATCKEISRGFYELQRSSTMIYVSNLLHTIRSDAWKQVLCVASVEQRLKDGNDLRPIFIVHAHPLFLRATSRFPPRNIHMITSTDRRFSY